MSPKKKSGCNSDRSAGAPDHRRPPWVGGHATTWMPTRPVRPPPQGFRTRSQPPQRECEAKLLQGHLPLTGASGRNFRPRELAEGAQWLLPSHLTLRSVHPGKAQPQAQLLCPHGSGEKAHAPLIRALGNTAIPVITVRRPYEVTE